MEMHVDSSGITPENFWGIAEDFPLSVMKSPLFGLFTLTEPERWLELVRRRCHMWGYQALELLRPHEVAALHADCAERALHLFEQCPTHYGDSTMRDAIAICREIASGLPSSDSRVVACIKACQKAATAHWSKDDHQPNMNTVDHEGIPQTRPRPRAIIASRRPCMLAVRALGHMNHHEKVLSYTSRAISSVRLREITNDVSQGHAENRGWTTDDDAQTTEHVWQWNRIVHYLRGDQ